ncbi:MAG: hypothetical protein ACPG19_01945 [Saprospiraceae bacterium]
MNQFLRYLEKNQLDIEEMSSDEIIGAYNASGSSNHNDFVEVAEKLPWLKRLRVLMARMEESIYPFVKGEHSSDS